MSINNVVGGISAPKIINNMYNMSNLHVLVLVPDRISKADTGWDEM